MKRMVRTFAGVTGGALAAFTGYVGYTYATYGRTPRRPETGAVLDPFVPDYEVRERHRIRVNAPAAITMAAARDVSFNDSPVVRLIFNLRDLPARLAGTSVPPVVRRSTMEEVRALGWKELAEEEGHYVAMGAVTQPWRQNVVFRGLAPEAFVAFQEPGFAKIAWTLEVEPIGPSSSVFRTETRVVTTDPASREKFRRYWSLLSPGIILIRLEMLRLVKADAERRADEANPVVQKDVVPDLRSENR